MAIINSLLDTDLYKLTMGHTVYHRFPKARAEYAFRNRTKGVRLAEHAGEIREEIDALGELRFTHNELDMLRGLRFMKDDYVDHLAGLSLDPDEVQVSTDNDGCLDITVKGPWQSTIFWEVPILAIVEEAYTRHAYPEPDFRGARRWLDAKIQMILDDRHAPIYKLADFGTRRRFSRDWHAEVVDSLSQRLPEQFVGTSNIDLARRAGLRPIGTMAHEYLQAAQALCPDLEHFQAFALEHWLQEFRGDLGIALTDCINFDAFLHDFDRLFVKAFDGLRHDSGDPFEWGEKAISHIRYFGVDPRTKTLVFSDGLDVPKSLAILDHFAGRVGVSFGIGTNLTNDIPGVKPLNIVMKLVRLNGRPVAKISDAPGKTMCRDEGYIEHLKELFADPEPAAN